MRGRGETGRVNQRRNRERERERERDGCKVLCRPKEGGRRRCKWGSGRGSVGGAVFSDTRGLRFKSIHWEIFIHNMFLSSTLTLMVFSGVTNAHRPSSQPTCRSLLCSLTDTHNRKEPGHVLLLAVKK